MHTQSTQEADAGQGGRINAAQDFRISWLGQVAADRWLVGQAPRVALAISENANSAKCSARLTQQQIADRLGITDRTVRAAVALLARRGHLQVIAKRGQQPNVYRLLIAGGRNDG